METKQDSSGIWFSKHEDVWKLLMWNQRVSELSLRLVAGAVPAVRRGEVWWCELGENLGSEENKTRPCVVIQSDQGNASSSNTIVAPISKSSGPTRIVYKLPTPLPTPTRCESNVLLGNIREVSRARIGAFIAALDPAVMREIDQRLINSVGLRDAWAALQKREAGASKEKLRFETQRNTALDDRKQITDALGLVAGANLSDMLVAIEQLKK